jgi:hypothetical protein
MAGRAMNLLRSVKALGVDPQSMPKAKGHPKAAIVSQTGPFFRD